MPSIEPRSLKPSPALPNVANEAIPTVASPKPTTPLVNRLIAPF